MHWYNYSYYLLVTMLYNEPLVRVAKACPAARRGQFIDYISGTKYVGFFLTPTNSPTLQNSIQF